MTTVICNVIRPQINYLKLLKECTNQSVVKRDTYDLTPFKIHANCRKKNFYYFFNLRLGMILIKKHKFLLNVHLTFHALGYNFPLRSFLNYQINNLIININFHDAIDIVYVIINLLKCQNIKKITLKFNLRHFDYIRQSNKEIGKILRCNLNAYSIDKCVLINQTFACTEIKNELWGECSYTTCDYIKIDKTCGNYHRNGNILNRINTKKNRNFLT